MHISFHSTSYKLNNCSINSQLSHKDLGVIICTDLQWHHHHDYMFGKAYKMFGITDVRTFSQSPLKLNYILPLSDHNIPIVQLYGDHIQFKILQNLNKFSEGQLSIS